MASLSARTVDGLGFDIEVMMLPSRWRGDQSNIEFVKDEIFDQRKGSDNEDSIHIFFPNFFFLQLSISWFSSLSLKIIS